MQFCKSLFYQTLDQVKSEKNWIENFSYSSENHANSKMFWYTIRGRVYIYSGQPANVPPPCQNYYIYNAITYKNIERKIIQRKIIL